MCKKHLIKPEEIFRIKFIQHLLKKDINSINLGNGTFDLIVEGNRPYIVEFKKLQILSLKENLVKNRGFFFTATQIKAISKMKFPPIVIAFDLFLDENYLFPPLWVQKEVVCREKYGEVLITTYFCEFPPSVTFEELINKISRFIFLNSSVCISKIK